MLALSDFKGFVSGSIPGLANAARMSIEDCKMALQNLMQPDPYSRTQSLEGRRVAEADGGWQIINYEKYRDYDSFKRAYMRDYMRVYRQKRMSKDVKSNVNLPCITTTLHVKHTDTYTDIEKENKEKDKKEKKKKEFVKPTAQEVEAYAQECGFSIDGQIFCDFYQSKGWLVGKSPMKDWRAAVRTWKKRHKAMPVQTEQDIVQEHSRRIKGTIFDICARKDAQ